MSNNHTVFICGTTLSQVIKEYAPVVSHHQSKSLPITKRMTYKVTYNTVIYCGTTLSQEYAPTISHH